MSEDTINNNTLLQTEKLEVSPVRAKGYGVISKVAMLDPRLTIQAKGIYAYLCSYGGRGNGIYPGRDRILTDLGITKDTYYTHFNMLKKYGYITVTQIKMGMYSHNVYTIVSDYFIEQQGYGVVPKLVMLDQNIDIKAKAIYAYLCSYAGTGYEAFPSLSDSVSCLGISIKTYYKYIHILMDDKYITTKNRTKNGMRASTIYILSTDPMQDKTIDEKQILKNQDTEISKNQDTEISKNQDTEIGKNQDTEIGKNQDTEIGKNQDMTIGKNQDTNNNREKNNTVNIKINPSNNTKSKNIVTRDGEMDDDAKRELTNSIIDQLYNDYVIPDLHKKNKNYITAAIHYLTNYDNRMIFLKDLVNTYENESKSYQIYVDTQLESFRLFVKALIELLLLHSEIILNKRAVTAYEVSEMLNEFIEQEKSSFNIQTLQETAIDDYQIASCEVEIRNHVKYMQACIWNVMLQGKTSKVNDTNMDLKADIAKRTKQ